VAVSKAFYCTEICKGKCCTLYPANAEPIRCPRQTPEGVCSVYEWRYQPGAPRLIQVGEVKGKPFICGYVEDIIEAGELPKEIADGCCYVHPNLLEQHYV